jgi:hypothetical protein
VEYSFDETDADEHLKSELVSAGDSGTRGDSCKSISNEISISLKTKKKFENQKSSLAEIGAEWSSSDETNADEHKKNQN